MSARSLSMWAAAALCAVACQVFVGSASAGELPDGRVYERVSSLAQYGSDVYEPRNYRLQESPGTITQLPFQSAADGEKVTFVAGPSLGGNQGIGENSGNQYLATRLPGGGWSQSNIAPVGAPESEFQAFSNDLSLAVLDSPDPLSSLAAGFGEPAPPGRNYDVLYTTATSGGEYVPLIETKPPFRGQTEFDTAELSPPVVKGRLFGLQTALAGASSDLSHLLFMANDALTPAAEGRPAAEGGAAGSFAAHNNLYEWTDGRLRLVNVLPNGTTHVNATFGGGPANVGSQSYRDIIQDFNRVISVDGSRIFWTDLSTGHIYVRENGSSTVEISSAGTYQTASSDGSLVFYVNGDLYEYDLDGARTTDLTPGVAVRRVVGASEDGKYVYYLTTAGELKLWHDGSTTDVVAAPVEFAEVTPDGHSIVFESSGRVEVYDSDTGQLDCASCTSGGTSGLLALTNEEHVYLPRWISADGSRVFFESEAALVPQDINEKADVYEWERPGAGSCPGGAGSTGCVYLLSGGINDENSYFADAGETGNDVFIVTREKLVVSDEDGLLDLYDARVDGYLPVSPPACVGTGCQGIPSAPPIFATPSSVTFEGVGNFPATVGKVSAKPKQKQGNKKPHKRKKKKKKLKVKKSARKAAAHKRLGSKGGRS